MALQSSGKITLKDIATEFSDTAPHTLKEFYDAASGIPASGSITLKDFYGAQAVFDLGSEVTPTTINGENTLKEITVSDYISSGEIFQIPSDWWIWSDNIATAAMIIDIPCTILNYGKIIGRGGNGGYGNNSSGQNGGPAIKINSGVSNVTITNYSGAYIAGGGGGGGGNTCGGGGGAGGGVGGGATDSNASAVGGVAGVVNASGSRGTSTNTGDPWRQTSRAGNGGGAGGGGGGTTSDYGGTYNGGGGGGGRILPGTGGAAQSSGTEGIVTLGPAPAGGSAGNNGGNQTRSGGGGGWAASGGTATGGSVSGGSGGAAIDDNGVTYTFTNNGTVYGTT